MSIVLILLLVIVAVILSVVAFLKTPSEKRFQVNRVDLQQRMAALPEACEAKLLKADRPKFIRRFWPFILIGLMLALLSTYLQFSQNPLCDRLFGISHTILNLWVVFLSFPLVIFIFSIYFALMGLRSLRSGYFPPLGTLVFNDTIAKKGRSSNIRAVLLIAMPFILMGMLVIVYQVLNQFLTEISLAEIQAAIVRECSE